MKWIVEQAMVCHYQRGKYAYLRNLVGEKFRVLRGDLKTGKTYYVRIEYEERENGKN